MAASSASSASLIPCTSPITQRMRRASLIRSARAPRYNGRTRARVQRPQEHPMNATPSATSDLIRRKCKACEGEGARLNDTQVTTLLAEVPGWDRAGGEIAKVFKFKNYH